MNATPSILIALALAPLAAAPALAHERALAKEVVVAAPVEAAFKAWTTNEGIQSFFAPEAFVEPRPDGRFSIHMNPYGAAGMKGADDMRVLGVQENRMLSFTWNAPPHLPDARRQRTVVIVRFEPLGESKSKVRLTHIGWGEGGQWDDAYKYFDRAWGNVLANLEKRFAEGKPVDWTSWLARLKAYEEEQAKKRK
ncbi:MAG TPA: SRPBCC domain-containing protein [Usitatibacter sp.]|nr:SRPBCC domain-containing protein [Usitatibacter sp.]